MMPRKSGPMSCIVRSACARSPDFGDIYPLKANITDREEEITVEIDRTGGDDSGEATRQYFVSAIKFSIGKSPVNGNMGLCSCFY